MNKTKIPNGWEAKRFDEIGMIFSGSTPSTTNRAFWDGEIIWITPYDLSGLNTPYLTDSSKRITQKGLDGCSAHLLPAGSLVISSRAPIGYVALPTVPFCTNQGCKTIKLKRAYDSAFAYYNVLFNIDKVKCLGEGTTFAEISKTALSTVELLFPSRLVEQKKIAEILSTVDRAIEQTEALIAKQQRIKTGLMQNLLTRGIDEHGNLRSEQTHQFKDSPLGRIPVEWEAKLVEQLIDERIISDVQDGNHGELHPKSRDFVDEGIPFIMASDIAEGCIDVVRAKKITEDQYQRLRTGFSKPGDVLLSHKASIGFVALVPESLSAIMLTPQVTYYRIGRRDILDPRYLAQFFRSTGFQAELKGLAKQSTRDYIGILAQRKLHVAYPLQLTEQELIYSLLNLQDVRMLDLQKLLNKLRFLKTALMQDLLSGKKQVTPLLALEEPKREKMYAQQ